VKRPLPINPYEFQERINAYASDIVILWDTTIERYQIYQTVEAIPGFTVHGMSAMQARKQKLRPMFTIQEANGDFRDPDESDLQRIIDSINNTINMRVKGYQHFADVMEKEDIAREEAVAPGVQDAMRWGAEEIHKARVRKGILGMM
jgi:hypothetical protein